jgi:hypothetical protein
MLLVILNKVKVILHLRFHRFRLEQYDLFLRHLHHRHLRRPHYLYLRRRHLLRRHCFLGQEFQNLQNYHYLQHLLHHHLNHLNHHSNQD